MEFSFMLPPNFRFPPDGKIKPGIIIEEGSNGLPDPHEELHDASLDPAVLETTQYPKFRYAGEGKSNIKINLWVHLLSLVEVGLGRERGHDYKLIIETGPAKTATFHPKNAYISNLMSDSFLSEYTKLPRRRPVYLITGVMIADNATIEIQEGSTSVYRAKVAVNGEGLGIPIRAGPEFEQEGGQTMGSTLYPQQPFVLAYSLKKIRRKVLGGFSSSDHDSHALWDEGHTAGEDDAWEVEDFVVGRDQMVDNDT
jgi:hypothetical protein